MNEALRESFQYLFEHQGKTPEQAAAMARIAAEGRVTRLWPLVEGAPETVAEESPTTWIYPLTGDPPRSATLPVNPTVAQVQAAFEAARGGKKARVRMAGAQVIELREDADSAVAGCVVTVDGKAVGR